MENNTKTLQYANWLIFFGILLFLFGLLIAFCIPIMVNQRMGLSAHLEGTMNGMFLVILGLIWSKISLQGKWLKITFWLSIYSSFANFLAVTLGAITGAGKMMPIAGGKEGNFPVEGLISFLLITLAIAMVVVCILVLSGLYKFIKQSS
ncbi:hydrogenase [Lacihabitans sp. LS3-19]|uniref:hydrogenase n=1 Tax=Lacihabitans sp. LS3-19 TaxID=2487335 RepID=UPI0020CCA871|nr:hydrogenase [Lacihabitans sp. LS3-19]MCP9768879.1 hydrogenase [Lacihabitans sp. LS3-19]